MRNGPVNSSIVELVLDDPDRRNPVTKSFVDQAHRALTSGADVIVIRSAGPTVFSGGGDLSLGRSGLISLSDQLYKLYEALLVSPTVVITSADGLAVGAGAQLVLAADLRVVGRRFALRTTDLTRGLAAGMWALPSDVGRSRALEIFLRGMDLTASIAVEWGLATEVSDDPDTRARELARQISAVPAALRARIKRSINGAAIPDDAIQRESAAFAPPLMP